MWDLSLQRIEDRHKIPAETLLAGQFVWNQTSSRGSETQGSDRKLSWDDSKHFVLFFFCKRLRVRLRSGHMYVGIYVLRDSDFFLLHRYQKPKSNGVGVQFTHSEKIRGTLSLLHQPTVGAKKPHSFANLKEIVHLQHIVLNWESHLVVL